jgi:hypothetical protein
LSLYFQAVPVEGGSPAATLYELFVVAKFAAGVHGKDGFLVPPAESVTTNL